MMTIAICALALTVFFAFGCAKDDNNLPNAGDTNDSQCDVFVDEYYDACPGGLFSMSRADAKQTCQNGEPADVWPCAMDCWDQADKDCDAWTQCIGDNNCLAGME